MPGGVALERRPPEHLLGVGLEPRGGHQLHRPAVQGGHVHGAGQRAHRGQAQVHHHARHLPPGEGAAEALGHRLEAAEAQHLGLLRLGAGPDHRAPGFLHHPVPGQGNACQARVKPEAAHLVLGRLRGLAKPPHQHSHSSALRDEDGAGHQRLGAQAIDQGGLSGQQRAGAQGAGHIGPWGLGSPHLLAQQEDGRGGGHILRQPWRDAGVQGAIVIQPAGRAERGVQDADRRARELLEHRSHRGRRGKLLERTRHALHGYHETALGHAHELSPLPPETSHCRGRAGESVPRAARVAEPSTVRVRRLRQ